MDAAKMVASVEKMIRSMAAEFARASKGAVLADDLMQIGRMAVLAATKTFNPANGAVFSTYAFRALRNAMGNELRRPRELACLNAPRFAQSGEDDECYLDGLPADVVASDERLAMAEREAQVRSIVERVKAEHFAAKPVLYALVIARLQLGVTIEEPEHDGKASTFRSEMTLEEIAGVCGCTREWVRVTETKIRARLAVALTEVA